MTEKIQSILSIGEFKLSEKIRTNPEIDSFIRKAMVPNFLDEKAQKAINVLLNIINKTGEKSSKEL